MKTTAALLLGLEYATSVWAASSPRGVAPEFAKFYTDTKTFQCISNPSIKIPSSQVNDDYCDCPDGSDEPGTSACAHLSPLSPHTPVDAFEKANNASAALPGFYCSNTGHRPSYVPFTNVNDGVCDYEQCCDGSEEWGGVGGVKCKNRCEEIGKEWRRQDAQRRKSQEGAVKKRRALVAEAAALRQAVQDKIASAQEEIRAGEAKVGRLEQELAEVQRSEAGKVVPAGKTGGKLGMLVALGKRRTEELRLALVAQIAANAERAARLAELEEIMTTFKEEYNPNFNDEGVKRAVRAWEEYVASKPVDGSGSSSSISDAQARDVNEISRPDKYNGINWDDFEGAEEEEQETASSDTDILYAFEEYLPPTLRTYIHDKLRELRVWAIANGILADTSDRPGSGSANESKKVSDARGRLEAAQRDVESSRTRLSESQDDLAKDFGPEDVFRALQGKCVETDSGEYTYELCFLERTTQKPKKGGAHTNMGSYTRTERVHVDDELPSDGKGLGSGERYALKYENGQHCWNGPSRSTTVVLACSEQNEIWKIVEEEKCVYRMEVGTPAVCVAEGEGVDAAEAGVGKDEL